MEHSIPLLSCGRLEYRSVGHARLVTLSMLASLRWQTVCAVPTVYWGPSEHTPQRSRWINSGTSITINVAMSCEYRLFLSLKSWDSIREQQLCVSLSLMNQNSHSMGPGRGSMIILLLGYDQIAGVWRSLPSDGYSLYCLLILSLSHIVRNALNMAIKTLGI